MFIWIMCGDAPFRLPIAMADSAGALAKMTGENEKTIRSIASRVKTGIYPHGAKFECVEIEDD